MQIRAAATLLSMSLPRGTPLILREALRPQTSSFAQESRSLAGAVVERRDTRGGAGYRTSVSFSVSADIFAVRSSLSQLNGLPSMARFTVLNSTTAKS